MNRTALTLGPHLHFQVSDAVEPWGGEGLPFALQAFALVGRIPSLPALLDGGAGSDPLTMRSASEELAGGSGAERDPYAHGIWAPPDASRSGR